PSGKNLRALACHNLRLPLAAASLLLRLHLHLNQPRHNLKPVRPQSSLLEEARQEHPRPAPLYRSVVIPLPCPQPECPRRSRRSTKSTSRPAHPALRSTLKQASSCSARRPSNSKATKSLTPASPQP